MQGEVLVGAAESGDEVILEGSDGAFGYVATMVTGWYKLIVDCFLLHEVLEDFGAFVVKSLKDGSKARLEKLLVDCLVCSKDHRARLALHGFCPDGV